VALVGFTVLAFGLAFVALPLPGALVIPLGLAILATEFAWAGKLLVPIQKVLERLKALTRCRRTS
jgi:hypothetical protein